MDTKVLDAHFVGQQAGQAPAKPERKMVRETIKTGLKVPSAVKQDLAFAVIGYAERSHQPYAEVVTNVLNSISEYIKLHPNKPLKNVVLDTALWLRMHAREEPGVSQTVVEV